MSKSLSNIRTYVRTILDESTPADWTDDQVDAAINFSYHEVVTLITEVYEDYYMKTDTLDTIEDGQEYGEGEGFPTDFFKIARVEINYDVAGDGTPSRAIPVNLIDVKRDLGNTNIGGAVTSSPAYYLIGRADNLKLGFLPIPTKGETDAIKVWYHYIVDDMDNDSDRPDIPYEDRYARLIAYGALADLLDKGQQESGAADKYQERFEIGMEKMKQQLEDRKADGVKGVTDVQGENLDFTEGPM